MADRFELTLRGPEGKATPLAEYLAALQAGKKPAGDPANAGILLVAEGQERMARWGMGDLDRLGGQCQLAADRLAKGMPAAIRSCTYDSQYVPFLIIEPNDAATCRVSLVLIPDYATSMLFPDNPKEAEPLYAYLAEHAETLLTPTEENKGDLYFGRLPFARPTMQESLGREAKRAEELAVAVR